MAKIEDGADSAKLLFVDDVGAARVTRRGLAGLGSYKIAVQSGLTTVLAAGGEVFQFRNTDATKLCVLNYLRVRAQVVTGFTAAQELSWDAAVVTNFSAAGSGGTQIVPTPGDFKKRQSMANSILNEARVSTTAILGVGTKTIGQAFLTNTVQELAAAATVGRAQSEADFRATDEGDQPLVFGTNEGFIVRNLVLMGAAGTIRWNIEAAWDEILASDY